MQESPGEGIRWSIISLHGIVVKDAGVYRCKAKNFAGNSESFVTLLVAGMETTTAPPPPSLTKKPDENVILVTQSPPPVTSTVASTLASFSPSTSKPPTTTLPPAPNRMNLGPGGGIQRSPPAGDTPAKRQQGKDSKSPSSGDKRKKGSLIKDIEVVEETGDTAVVLWTSEGLTSDMPLSVVYFPYEAEDDKESLEAEVGLGKLLLENLLPNQVYTVCLIAKGLVSGKDSCVNFSTLDTIGDDGQNKWLMIASGIACVLALPLIVLLLYKIVSLYCKGRSSRNAGMDDDLAKETYVKFETLTMKQRTLNGQANDLWARRQTQESERMLLCSRSSIDSQMTYKSDSSRSEYLC